MNSKGQGLLGAVIVVAILSIAMMAMISLYSGMARQQAQANRQVEWTQTVTAIGTLLRNSDACAYTLVNGGAIYNAAGYATYKVGASPTGQFMIVSIVATPIGGATNACNQDGNSNNFKCGDNAYQHSVTVVASIKLFNKLQTKSQTYYVNLLKNSKGQVLGCL